MSAEHKGRFSPVRPYIKGQDSFVCLATNDQRIHRRHERIVAMGFPTSRGKKIESAMGSSDKAIEARANEDGCFHYRAPPNTVQRSA